MKITVLMENSASRPGIRAEHGLSLYVETAQHRILADTGASARTWENADALGVDITGVDYVFISHGHYDHAGGVLSFAERNPEARIFFQRAAAGEFFHGEKYIGIDRRILSLPQGRWPDEDFEIDEELYLFTGFTGRRRWPAGNRELTERTESGEVQDTFAHEQALVVREGGKKVLFSGCAHSGILNILDRFREIFGTDPDAVISGFHMMKKSAYTPEETADIRGTAAELAGLRTQFYTGHCTGEAAFGIMKEIMPENLHAIHAGDRLEL